MTHCTASVRTNTLCAHYGHLKRIRAGTPEGNNIFHRVSGESRLDIADAWRFAAADSKEAILCSWRRQRGVVRKVVPLKIETLLWVQRGRQRLHVQGEGQELSAGLL